MKPLEILTDFRQYAPAVLKVKHREGGRVVPFQLKPIQHRIVDVIAEQLARRRPPRLQVLKARRLGVSTVVAGLFFHRIATYPYQRGNVVAHRGDSAEAIFSIYERFYQELPEVWHGIPIKPKRSGTRGKRLGFVGLHSELVVGTAGTEDFGRGGDCQVIHFSEVAYYADPERVLASILPQVPATGDSMVVLESTAKGPGDFFHQLWQDSQDGVSGYVPLFFAWFEDPDHRLPEPLPPETWTEEERTLAQRFGVDGSQLAWRRFKLETECFGNEDRFRLEYPSTPDEAFTAVGDPAWETSVLLGCYERKPALFRGELTGQGVLKAPGGRLIVWEEPQPGAEYVIGVDVAAGLSTSDLNAALVFRVGRKPGQWPIQVAEWTDATAREDPITFAQTLTYLGHYYQKALLAVEVTGLGRGTQNALQRVYCYPRLHRWIPWDRFKTSSDTWGWETSWKSKPVMLGIGDWLLRTKHVTLRSPWLLEELMNYKQVGSGEFTGLKGDDRMMAWLIGMCSWFQHCYPGVSLKDLRATLARLYGGTHAVEQQVPPSWAVQPEPGTEGTRKPWWRERVEQEAQF